MIEKIQINANAILLRKKFKEDIDSPIDIFSLVNTIDNLTIVFLPMSRRLSGLCVKVDSNNIVAINSSMTYGRQRFTMAHELCHLYFHDKLENSVCLNQLNQNGKKDTKEEEADIFASYFLAPYESFQSYIRDELKKDKGTLVLEDIVKIEQYYGLSRAATLNRLIEEGYLDNNTADKMKTDIIASATRLGYDTCLYKANAEERQYHTIGKYIRLAQDIGNRELISTGRYEELLLDAFRADIVYGLDGDEEDIYD